MVVCKCRKATMLYCFVHKVPVCGDCICLPEHQLCVVRTYSEWVIDGEYNWPPDCCLCHALIEEGSDPQTTRLGCLHIIHASCLVSHIRGLPPHSASYGYACPACSMPLWPPKSIKDSGSLLLTKQKEAITQSGVGKNFFENRVVSVPAIDSHSTPSPAFASDSLKHVPPTGDSLLTVRKDSAGHSASTGIDLDHIVEVDSPNLESLSNLNSNLKKSTSPTGASATTRKSASHDRQNSDHSYYADDEDGDRKKYTQHGALRHKLFRALLPFWSSALPTLPMMAPPRKDSTNMDNVLEDHKRHQRSSKMDSRKVLLLIAIMASMATMGILYHRIAQGGFGKDSLYDEQ
ncbi:hypothetical protein NMG60_11019776 [Bertholletia excelsa]